MVQDFPFQPIFCGYTLSTLGVKKAGVWLSQKDESTGWAALEIILHSCLFLDAMSRKD
jgi:hypothetical protein